MHLTDTECRKLAAPAKGNKISYDDEVKGFGVRVTKGGARSFVLNYRAKPSGRERRLTIGSFPDWPTAAARVEAKRLKREVDLGADPVGDLDAVRVGPTLKEVAERDWSDVLSVKRRASTLATYRRQLDKDILPALSHLKISAVTVDDIAELHRKITTRGSPIAANRVIALLSGVMRRAIDASVRAEPNPVTQFCQRKGVMNKERARNRYLTADEAERLSAALAACEDRQAVDILRLLWLSGARLGELLAAQWSHFDLTAGRWRKPFAIVKGDADHSVPLSADAIELLRAIPRDRVSPYLFPALDKAGRPTHRQRIERPWTRIRKAAGLADFKTHDVRHSFASCALANGAALPTIAKLLGHRSIRTTLRYAHANDQMLRDATERVAETVRRAGTGGKVVPLR